MKNMASIRLKVLVALLVAVGVLAGASLVQTSMLEQELTAYAETHAEQFRDGDHEVAYTITVGREYGLFGQPVAKITTFARPKGAQDTEILTAVDFGYVKQAGQWINTDSGICTHDGCISGAEGAFARLGSGEEN